MKNFLHSLFHGIFWLWNIMFLLVVYAGIMPIIGVAVIVATWEGFIPVEFFLTLAGLVIIPIACTVIAGKYLYKYPLQLIRLFYGVETPLFVLCLIRLFMLRELTPASSLVIGTAIICIFAFAFELVYRYGDRNPKIAWLQLICHSLMAVVGLYIAAILLFYAIPIAAILVREFFRFQWLMTFFEILFRERFLALWWLGIFFLLFCFSAALFVVMPPAMAGFYIFSGQQIWRKFAAQYDKKNAVLGSGAAITAWLILFIAFQNQPQIPAFNLLAKPAITDSDRQELLAKSDLIRTGLVNAYLASYRYMGTDNNIHIKEMYSQTFGLPESVAQGVQNSYNILMSPFLYKGNFDDDTKAEKIYAKFFDVPIQKQERKLIKHALQSTYNQEEAKAGVLNIDDEKIFLAKQEITVNEKGDWADIEIYEKYLNQTTQEEEVFYSFSLPESAVITGVWLGNTNNRDSRFTFQVSPRGAAQKVYNAQVQRRIDPALLEQVGPRHYRLRAFPVPPKLFSLEVNLNPQIPRELHLWVTYKVMRQKEGWALPHLGEKRNVFWNYKTERIYNGKQVKNYQNNWLPEFINASQEYPAIFHQVNLPGGYIISAKPLGDGDYVSAQGKRVAVVLDTSRSMVNHSQAVQESFNWLKNHGFAENNLANNDADLYLTAFGKEPDRIDDISKFNPSKVIFYGTLDYQDMIGQFEKLRGNTIYDAILLLTDEGSYELSKDSKDIPKLSAPLWMVHLGGLPRAYNDATLKLIQDSRGGVATQIPEVLPRLATQAKLGASVVSVVDGYAWFMENNKPLDIKSLQKELEVNKQLENNTNWFEPLGARQLIIGLAKNVDVNNLGGLDVIHAIAKNFKIVSPYSSMIVLVNEQQKQELKRAESEKNRFDREVENGKKELTKPTDMMKSSSIPEPESWLGILTAIAFLIVVKRQQLKAH